MMITVNIQSTSVICTCSQSVIVQGHFGLWKQVATDYKEMYWDFNDLGKSYDLIMKLEINVLYLQIVVSCVPCVSLKPLRSVLVVEIPGGVELCNN